MVDLDSKKGTFLWLNLYFPEVEVPSVCLRGDLAGTLTRSGQHPALLATTALPCYTRSLIRFDRRFQFRYFAFTEGKVNSFRHALT